MSLNIAIERRIGGVVCMQISGMLDTNTYRQFDEHIQPFLNPATKVLMLNLAGLQYISSMGLRSILHARKAIENGKGSVLMMNVQPQIAKVFEIANALPNVPVFANTADADRYLDAIQRKAIDPKSA